MINRIGSDIDLFIDDGSHVPEHQVSTCLTAMPLLDKDVTYIIEDVRALERVLPHLEKHKEYDCEVITYRNARFDDDRLIIVRHKKEETKK